MSLLVNTMVPFTGYDVALESAAPIN